MKLYLTGVSDMCLYTKGLRTDTPTMKVHEAMGSNHSAAGTGCASKREILETDPSLLSRQGSQRQKMQMVVLRKVTERYDTPCYPSGMVNGDSGGASGQCNVSAVRVNPNWAAAPVPCQPCSESSKSGCKLEK